MSKSIKWSVCCLILFYICSSFSYARTIELNAHYSYKNDSTISIKKVTHRVTIPLESNFQKIIKINSHNVAYSIKRKKNRRYIELYFSLPAHDRFDNKLTFQIELFQGTYSLDNSNFLSMAEIKKLNLSKFIEPDKFSESDSREVKAIAKTIAEGSKSEKNKVIAGYKFVNRFLIYKKIRERTSALTSLKNAYGDCTEFADLFVAIMRAMNIPARTVSLFNFSKTNSFDMPNHNEAEIYLKNTGWVPIYTNLGAGRESGKYGIGKVSDDNLIYLWKGWTWSNHFSSKKAKGKLNYHMKWEVKE